MVFSKFLLDSESHFSNNSVVLVVYSLERKYNISINTGNNTLCLVKDDDDYITLHYIYLDVLIFT